MQILQNVKRWWKFKSVAKSTEKWRGETFKNKNCIAKNFQNKNGVAKEIQNKMVPAARFELTTSKLGILRSILLSYGGIYAKIWLLTIKFYHHKKHICVKALRQQRPLAMTAWDKFATQIYLNFSQDEI